MPQCRYVILDHHKSDLASDSFPCLLLLDINHGERSTVFIVFVVPDIDRLLDGMSNQQRNWMLGVLINFCDRQHKSNHIGTPEFEQFWSLGVGPLRTSVHGTIQVGNMDSVRDLICVDLRRRELSKDYPYFLSSFQELRPDLLHRFDVAVPN